eukprot:2886995-Rhodomonas_salina.1
MLSGRNGSRRSRVRRCISTPVLCCLNTARNTHASSRQVQFPGGYTNRKQELGAPADLASRFSASPEPRLRGWPAGEPSRASQDVDAGSDDGEPVDGGQARRGGWRGADGERAVRVALLAGGGRLGARDADDALWAAGGAAGRGCGAGGG